NELYEGRSLENGGQTNRLIYLNSFREYGVIAGNNIILGDRESDGSADSDSKHLVYSISNKGSKTLFTAVPAESLPAIDIRRFNQFQEGLLRNYPFYSEAIRSTSMAAKDSHK